MIIIDIDTMVLKGLVSAASVANESIDNAVDALNRVSVHNDWGCKEKNAINDYAITNRNKIKKIQENSRGFLNEITHVANEFETSENSIIDWFTSVESILGDLLKVGGLFDGREHTGTNREGFPGGFDAVVRGWLGNRIIDDLGALGRNALESYTRDTIIKGIPICNFEDIDLG